MSIEKHCADRLRAHVPSSTGDRLRACHAHEFVAAFFGYGTAAALRAENKYPLSALQEAKFLLPDLERMDKRLTQLRGLPSSLPSVDRLASTISEELVNQGLFNGEVWQTRKLDDDVNSYVQENPLLIEDALSGPMAETNAYFDELYIDEYAYQRDDDALVVTLEGTLNGETHEDRVFHGDKIAFTTTMTFKRAAGRVAFSEPKFETDGSVDDSSYYDLD